MTEQIIFSDSPEAASLRTVTGWVSRNGIYYGNDEQMARYDGCTHRACNTCGAPTEKPWKECSECRHKMKVEAFKAMPRAPWDGVCMVYSDARDEYYNSPADAAEDLEEGQALEDLRLILCEPVRGRHIDEDHFSDQLPEDSELPDELVRAIVAFNKAVDAAPMLSWAPGKVALDVWGVE